MSELLFLSTFTEDSIKYLWIIVIIILMTMCLITVISKRITTDDESFRKNFKIGFYRTIGAITSIFLTYVTIITIFYTINVFNESKTNKYNTTKKCIQYTYINGKKVCAFYEN